MTTVESIQQNIHNSKLGLIKSRKQISNGPIEELHKQSNIEHYLNDLKELKFCLKQAVKCN